MAEIANALILLFGGIVFLVLLASIVSIVRLGPSGIERLERLGFGFRSYFTGDLSSLNEDATINVIKGIEMKAKDGRIAHVRSTSTLSDEIE